MDNFKTLYKKYEALVMEEIHKALDMVDIDALEWLAKDICNSKSVFLTGTGRVLMAMQAFCKRLTHLGISAHCVGDITEPALAAGDLLIAASGSGESIVPVAVAKKAKELGGRVVHIGSNTESSMRQYCDYMVRVPVKTRLNKSDEIASKQIMTSLFEQTMLILGDILAMMIMEEKGLKLKELWEYHANIE